MEPIQQQTIIPPIRPKNWLVEAILVTIFCCLPFGIAGIVFAAQVNSKYDSGDYEGAVNSSKEAAKWTRVGFFASVILFILYMVFVFMLGGVAFWQAGRHAY